MHRTVSIERGAAWYAEGWRLFTKSPGLLIGMTAVLVLIMLLLNLIPFLGWLISMLAVVLLAAGLYVALDRLHKNEPAGFNLLFAGFGELFRPLLILALIFVGAQIVISIVIALVVGGGMMGATLMGGMMPGGEPSPEAMASMLQAGMTALMLALILALPLFMAYTFAVPLVCFSKREPVSSLKESFFAVAANWAPFIVFGLIYIVLAVVASIPFMLGWLVLLPVLFAAGYAAYRDVFAEQPNVMTP
ncbi:MAG: hypothetical protein C4528_07315 [Gammaproteobacteria bacterium]|nr:MAG: hypothetical protein C4528_07315 [Gammaproteobacteria bacterium]